MKRNFHQSIQKGKLSSAADILLNGRVNEDIRNNLTLIKMRLSLIEEAIIQGRINRIENVLELKSNVAYQLLKIHKEIQTSTHQHPHISTLLHRLYNIILRNHVH